MKLDKPKINEEILARKKKKRSNPAPIESLDLDFITYACHYDHSTILTKNGNLLQAIKIEDYSFSAANAECSDLRSEIRKSIAKNINTSEFTLWIYTVRKHSKISLKWEDTGDFSDELHNSWQILSEDKLKYVNELYIVILINSLNESFSHIINALSFNYVKNKHKLYLQNKCHKLQNVVDLILVDLKPFQAKKLELISYPDDKIRSEILEFFNYVITLTHSKYHISNKDLSEDIKNLKTAFGFNSFQIINNNQKKFGATLSIKEYKEVPLKNIDLYLQLNCEFITTEIIRFIESSEAITAFQKQIDILQISEDEELSKNSGLEEITGYKNQATCTTFCKHKINFTIIADSEQKLNKNVFNAVSALSSIGLMTIRNDLHLENNFWSQLPGNFIFVAQQKNILTKYACGFGIIHSFAAGVIKGRRWGEAITTFLSDKGNPYFFNFHGNKNSGHTMVLGLPKSGRTLLINFLLSESRRLNTKIVIFDNSGKSIIFTRAISGKYYIINPQHKNALQFNPLKIENSANNYNMLCELLKRMVGTIEDSSVEIAIRKIVDYIFSLPVESRSMTKISVLLEPLGGNIKKWYGDGEFASIFTDDLQSFSWKEKVLGINIGNLTKQVECMFAVLYYVLYRLEMELDGSPTILVLDEAWKVSSIFTTEQEFDDWMQRMTELNVVVIFSTENLSTTLVSKFSQYIQKHLDTKILMPNPYASTLYREVFSLSKEELNMMLQIPSHDRHFLFKQNNESLILTLNLSQMREIHVLSANNKTVKYMHDTIQEKGDKTSEWLPEFYEKCKN